MVYELDAVVVAPQVIYVVEVKPWRGRIEGTDHDWYIPEPIQSPVPLPALPLPPAGRRLHGRPLERNWRNFLGATPYRHPPHRRFR